MSALSADEQRELLDNSRQQAVYARPSKSPLRHLGEGNVNTCAGFAWSADGLTHPQFVLTAARVGHADSIALIAEVASAVLSKYPDRADDKALAISMLADLETNYPAVLKGYLAVKGAA
jgi:putative chitinase